MNSKKDNCKVCKKEMKRDMNNVHSRKFEGIVNWLGICSKECLDKMKQDDINDLVLEGRLSYLYNLGRNQGE